MKRVHISKKLDYKEQQALQQQIREEAALRKEYKARRNNKRVLA